MQRSLLENTERINVLLEKQISIKHANNTQDAVNHGASLAMVSAIDYVVEVLKKELGRKPKCIITGGMADLIQSTLRHSFISEPDLVLKGLSIAHRLNQ